MKKPAPVILNIEDDPQTYTLTRDINIVCDVEAETGLNLSIFAFSAGMTTAQERALLFAYLKTAHAVTIAEAGDLLSYAESAVLEALGKAMKTTVKIEAASETPQLRPETQGPIPV